MPFKDFIPEGTPNTGGEGDGFKDWIPEKKISDKEPEIIVPKPAKEPKIKEKVEVTDEDLEDMGIDKEKLEKAKQDLDVSDLEVA